MKNIQKIKNLLSAKIGSGKIISDNEIMERYSRDETSDLVHFPDLVIRADCTRDVSETLKACSEYNIPVVPRGAGTGVTGGAIPVSGGVVLSLELMNKILEIDRENMTATVEPGVITGVLQRAVLEHGLMYPPDPSSLDSCSIGGNVAESAGGPRAVKYGTTKDYILGLEFVLPNGDIINTGGRFVKNATGYNLTGILIGSEGTLGVITKIHLRLIPAPVSIIDLLIPYDSLEDAADDVFRIISNKIGPAALEFMEEDAIKLAAGYLKNETPFPEAKAHLLVQLDSNSEESLRLDLEKLVSCVRVNQEKIIVAENKTQSERIWKSRRVIREAISHDSPVFLAEDCVVPRSQIPAFLKRVKNHLNSRNIRSIIFGHAGDGNVHVDVLKGDMDYTEWKKMLPDLKKQIYEIAISMGGTITGEHGIGFIRKKYLSLALSKEEIELLKRIKAAFDPKSLLNPHKIF